MRQGQESPTRSPPSSRKSGVGSSRRNAPGRSCFCCYQRKVKCDGNTPCGRCDKAGVKCVTNSSNGRTRTAKVTRRSATLGTPARDVMTTERGGAQDNNPPTKYDAIDHSNGRVTTEDGRPRYIENRFWTGLDDELHSLPRAASSPPSNVEIDMPRFRDGDDLLFGRIPNEPLRPLHPTPAQTFWLWQLFLDNVNSLVKVIHAPLVQPWIIEAMSNLDKMTPPQEALLFSIYLAAFLCVQEEECVSNMGQSKKTCIEQFTTAAQHALSRADLMRSADLTVLQAFTLFILAIRSRTDAQTMWLMTGMAVRLSQRLGLHREKALQTFTVFDAEIKRRLWWQIILLDTHAAKLCGVAQRVPSDLDWDTKLPSNINDSELHPQMSELPADRVGATDMMFCSVRYDASGFMLRSDPNDKASHDETERKTGDLEQRLREKYVRYCDPCIPLHALVMLLVDGILSRIRFAAKHPSRRTDKGASLSVAERHDLFRAALAIIRQGIAACHEKRFARYYWHMTVFFPLDSLIFVLSELAHRDLEELSEGNDLAEAWRMVEQAFDLQTRLTANPRNALYKAIGSLAVRAWSRIGLQDATTPHFVTLLRGEQSTRPPAVVCVPSSSMAQVHQLHGVQTVMEDPEDLASHIGLDEQYDIEVANIVPEVWDWEYWQNLIDGDWAAMGLPSE